MFPPHLNSVTVGNSLQNCRPFDSPFQIAQNKCLSDLFSSSASGPTSRITFGEGRLARILVSRINLKRWQIAYQISTKSDNV